MDFFKGLSKWWNTSAPSWIKNPVDIGVAGAKGLHDGSQAASNAAFKSAGNTTVRPWMKFMQYMGAPSQLNPAVYGDAPTAGGPVPVPQAMSV